MSAVLSSWKEIASYLGKGVRTVQRWELELALPVRRPKPKFRQIVLAFPHELDSWVLQQQRSEREAELLRDRKSYRPDALATAVRTRELLKMTMEQTRLARQRAQQLLQRTANVIKLRDAA